MQNSLTYAMAHTADLGLVAGDVTPCTDAMGVWMSAYPAHITAQANAESAVRELVRRLQASPAVSDEEREALGITVRDTEPTPIGPPVSRPVGEVDTSQRRRHIIEFRDEGSARSKAKPDGVMACEVWVKLGDPAPLDLEELRFLATDSKTPYTAAYDGEDAGKTAHYMLRWISTRNEPGPWSETVSATIGG
jgi:hypothetical protein